MCTKTSYDKKGAATALNYVNGNRHRFVQTNERGYSKIKLLKRHKKEHKWRKAERIYYCNECNAWHLTSMEEEEYKNYAKDTTIR